MSKFRATQVTTVSVPNSFRRDLMALADAIEGPMSPISQWDVCSVIEVILDAPPEATEWQNYDKNLSVRFEAGE